MNAMCVCAITCMLVGKVTTHRNAMYIMAVWHGGFNNLLDWAGGPTLKLWRSVKYLLYKLKVSGYNCF